MKLAVIIIAIAAVVIILRLLRRSDALYLGAAPIATNDPLLLAAQARAKETLPIFQQLAPAHMTDAMVKFRFAVTDGTEQVWAYLRALDGDHLRVSVAHPLVDANIPVPEEQSITLDEVTDWQIEMHDGTIRGGFTNHAMFPIHRRDGYPIPREALQHEARFIDA
jgi:hypothetical protein